MTLAAKAHFFPLTPSGSSYMFFPSVWKDVSRLCSMYESNTQMIHHDNFEYSSRSLDFGIIPFNFVEFQRVNRTLNHQKGFTKKKLISISDYKTRVTSDKRIACRRAVKRRKATQVIVFCYFSDIAQWRCLRLGRLGALGAIGASSSSCAAASPAPVSVKWYQIIRLYKCTKRLMKNTHRPFVYYTKPKKYIRKSTQCRYFRLLDIVQGHPIMTAKFSISPEVNQRRCYEHVKFLELKQSLTSWLAIFFLTITNTIMRDLCIHFHWSFMFIE